MICPNPNTGYNHLYINHIITRMHPPKQYSPIFETPPKRHRSPVHANHAALLGCLQVTTRKAAGLQIIYMERALCELWKILVGAVGLVHGCTI